MRKIIKLIILAITTFMLLNGLVLETNAKLWENWSSSEHSCYIENNWTMKCWWLNNNWQLWNWDRTPTNTPVDILTLSWITQVSLWINHSCVLLNNWQVKCWGLGSYWSLWTWDNSSITPILVSSLQDVKQIALWQYHSCALLNDKTVKCWWHNSIWQLWNLKISDSDSTFDLVSWLSNAKQIALWQYHSCSLLDDWGVKCWWSNIYAELWIWSSVGYHNSPVSVLDLSNAKQIAVWRIHSCVLLDNDTVKCWGNNSLWQLWDWTIIRRSVPVTVSWLSNVKQISLWDTHSCSLLNDWTVKCWWSRISNWADFNSNNPVLVDWLQDVKYISSWRKHNCASLIDWTVKCWWYNVSWQLWNWTSINSNIPVLVSWIEQQQILQRSTWQSSDWQIEASIEIEAWSVSIYHPDSIDLGKIQISSTEQNHDIVLDTPNFFWVEDASWNGWYYATIQISDLSDWNKIIESENAKIKIGNVIYTLAWEIDTSSISVPSWLVEDFVEFSSNSPATIFQRSSTDSWIIWKYWVLPTIRLSIPAYQKVWKYNWVITFTLIEE